MILGRLSVVVAARGVRAVARRSSTVASPLSVVVGGGAVDATRPSTNGVVVVGGGGGGKKKKKKKKGKRPSRRQPPRGGGTTTQGPHPPSGSVVDAMIDGERRPIMTRERLPDGQVPHYGKNGIVVGGDVREMARQAVHVAQAKMLFRQRYEHRATSTSSKGGGMHDALFVATLRTTIDAACLCSRGDDDGNDECGTLVDDDGNEIATTSIARTVEFVNVGAARKKREAETYAAIDLIIELADMGIDLVNDPPDLAARRRAVAEERFDSDVRRARMILEALDASRPTFDTRTAASGHGFVSTARFYCRGVPIVVTSSLSSSSTSSSSTSSSSTSSSSSVDGMAFVGRSKAEAEGRALLAATSRGSVLESFVGSRKMDDIRDAIAKSPSGHVAALHVPPLPDDALDALTVALGSRADRRERMERHEKAMIAALLARRGRECRGGRSSRRDDGGGRSSSSSSSSSYRDVASATAINDAFLAEERSRAEDATRDPDGIRGRMRALRDSLPIKAIREDLVDSLVSRRVVVVSGGTGSGKSTQCPQYILEDAIANGRGADTRIIVTQPRRIAAISLSRRIAAERDEGIGHSVGYSVRHDARPPRSDGCIEFVTTGVLLRRLINDPSLEGISHVMIDEVHERDIDTDYLLILLRDLLAVRPELRVVLMSATLDADSFREYFSSDRLNNDPVPVMSVPAKPRHPVDVIHLEDLAGEGVTSSMGNGTPPDIRDLAESLLRLHDQRLQFELEEALAEEAAALRLEDRSIDEEEGEESVDGDDESSDSDSDTDSSRDGDESSQSSLRLKVLRRAVTMRGGAKGRVLPSSSPTAKQQNHGDKRDIGEITTKLLAMTARHVAEVETAAGRSGSILCFLPGLDEIKDAMTILEDVTDPSLKKRMKILPLHSTIPQDDQQKIFDAAADGTVKVILATNLAESSVTIDDVLALVDSGLVRENHWDAEKSMSSMLTVPTSKASATQRLGRAGRVAPGKCYRLYSMGQYEAMLERPLPEIQRSALEATCLNTCSMTNDKVATFLSRALDPPKEEAVKYSMERLKKLGAISVDSRSTDAVETLTPLGNCLSQLPLDPAIGRMLIMGCVMQCLDPILTAAACFSSRDVFFTPPGFRDSQRKIRREFCEHSDTLAAVRAYEEYNDVLQDEGWDVARQWASDNFISISAMASVHSIRLQLINELHRIGLVHHSDLEKSRGRNKTLRADATLNRNSGVESLYSAVWACSSPDNLAARQKLGSFGTLRTRMEDRTGLHPSSVTFHRKPPANTHRLPPWFSYREMVLSSQVFLRGCTALTPEQILLFGGYSFDGNQRLIDEWIMVEGQCADTLDVLSAARREINAALELTVMNPRKPLPEVQRLIVDAVCDCFDVLDETD